jgi:hypothetical protein
MKIVTQNLKEYAKLFDKVKIPKNQQYGSVYFDFENEFMYFRNETTSVKIPLIIEEKDEIKNLFVIDGEKIFYLINNYNEIIYDGKNFISPDNNKFELSKSTEYYEIPSFDLNDSWEKSNIILDSDTLFHLRNGILYADNNESPLSGLFIENGKLIALQPSKFYQSDISIDSKLILPLFFVRVLLSLDFESIELFSKKIGSAYVYILSNESITIKYSTSSALNLPVDINDENFVNSYNHSTYLKVDKTVFTQGLRFLDPFTKDIINSKAHIKFLPNKNEILFTINDTSNKIEYSIPVEEFSDKEYFKDAEMYFSIQAFNMISSHIDNNYLYIFFNKEKPAVKFASELDSNYFIIQTRIKQD